MKYCFYFAFLFIFLIASETPILYAKISSESSSEKVESEVKEKTVSFYNVFHSSVFDSYFIQLKEFLFNESSYETLVKLLGESPKNDFLIKIENLVDFVNQTPTTSEEKRTWHEYFLKTVRELIEMKKSYETSQNPAILSSKQWIDEITFWMYSKPLLLEQYQRFLVDNGLLAISDCKNDLSQAIEKTFDKISQSTQFQGHVHPRQGIVDSHLDGYLPHHIFDAFSVHFIITPRITIDFKETNEEKICPEFINYLDYLKSNNKTHLYINAMKRVDSGDQKYSKVIENLNLEREFEDVLWVATFDKKSDFYWQKNNYSNIAHAEHFKKAFICELFEKPLQESLFKWPRQMELASWKSHCRHILDSVHLRFFKNKNSLSLQERLDFIEIAYVAIIQNLCDILRPDFANISCKESMDRAPSIFSTLYVFDRLQSKKTLSLEDKIQVVTMLLAPPLVSHNRPSHVERINRTASAIKHLIAVLQRK